MNNYVLGFAFSTDVHGNRYVALIEKVKPDWQRGKLNGIGGKIESFDVTIRDAMRREFHEETGIETDSGAWIQFAKMEFDDDCVFCYAGKMDWEKFNDLWSPTPEQVVKISVSQLWNFKTLPNLTWLIPMAEAFLENPHLPALILRELKNRPAYLQ